MTFSHTTGIYNVHATLVAWLQGVYSTPAPAVGSAITINLDHPTQPIVAPDISAYFLSILDDPNMQFQGSHTGSGTHGRGKFGLLEVDLWVSRAAANWRAQLIQLYDLLSRAVINLHSTGGAVTVKDFYTNSSTPADTSYLVRIEGIEESEAAHDPNPQLERKRVIVTYSWVERV